MKRRILAVLLALAVVLALALPALAAVSADTVPYNTGTRHELCTALSAQAEQYYTDGAETLLKLSGSTSDSSLESMDSALYRALQSLMTDTMTDSVTYKSLPTYWARTDASQGKDGLLLFYSDTTGGSMSREHVWPKSRASFMQQNGGSDLHHLRPEDSGVNSTRSNYTMGNVLGVYPDCSTKAFDGKTVLWYSTKNDRVEVADNVKGDLARVLLYVYCRWGQPNLFETVASGSLPPFDGDDRENTGMPVIESLDTLLEWMQEDPVDTWEMSRNDCVQQVQGNRNVFIDYPEFAWLLFGRELPADYDTPSGYAREHGSDAGTFALTAVSSDETRGTVTVRSHTVTAFPAEGYCVGGYTLTPADAAVVKQNGNVFTVSRMTKDCTLTVQFDPRTPSTVHFSVPEGVTAPADAAGYTGDTFTFPQPSGTPSDTAHDYTFFGWAAAPQTDTDSRPDFSAAGAEQVFTQAEQTYYALYYYKVDDPDAVGDEYRRVMVAPDDWTGSYCIVSSDKGKIMTNTPGSKPTYLEAADIEIDTGSVRDPKWVYTLTAAGDGTYYVRDAAGLYLSCTGKKNVSLTETPDDTCRWTPTLNGLQSDNGMLQYNASSPRFTTYTSSQAAAHLYAPAAGSKTWYTTLGGSEPTPHEHTWGVWKVVEAATCFHDGLEARSCTGCDAVESRVIPATGHTFGEWTTVSEPGCFHEGTQTRSCSGCGETETRTIPANSDNCPSKAFTDRPDRGWYHESVDYVLETGLMNGMGKGKFEPDTTLNRAMVATVLYRLSGDKVSATNAFPDVPANEWYGEAVAWAQQKGIVTGFEDGTFRPMEEISRQDMALMLQRYAKTVKGTDTTPTGDLSRWPDAGLVGSWAVDALRWCVGAGIINGKDGGLQPTGNATRAEFATILMRYAKL